MEQHSPDNPFSVPDDVDAGIHEALGRPEAEQAAAFEELAARFPAHAEQIRERKRMADDDRGAGGTLQLGRYELVARLGAGGMGTVHMAFDPQLERHVAIKVMAPHLLDRPALRKRFALEATAVAAIRHPNICRVLEAKPDGEQPYIVMDFLEGKSLDKRLEEASLGIAPMLPGMPTPNTAGGRGSSTPTSTSAIMQVLEFVEKIARALHELHQRGIVHRDVKPSNIMVSPDGEPVVLDFGLVLSEQMDGASRSGDRPGTREYQAPEQLAGNRSDLDARADAFSLGLVLYECLTGARAFGVDRSASTLPEPAHRLNRSISRDVRTVLEKSIELDRKRRYASGIEFAEDLRRVREGVPPLSKPVGVVGRAMRWSLRNPWASAFIIALLAGLASSVAGFSQAHEKAGELELLVLRERGLRDELEAKVSEVDQLAGVVLLGRARRQELESYPAWPAQIASLRTWLDEYGRRLIGLEPGVEKAIRRLEGRLRASGASSPAEGSTRATSEEFMLTTLRELETGIAHLKRHTVPRVRRKLAWAENVKSLSIDRFADAWERARTALKEADGVEASSLYARSPIDLRPQIGLIPLGVNPKTKLLEFYHLRSARADWESQDVDSILPHRDSESGQLVLSDRHGVVFVLIPGGTFMMGSSESDVFAHPSERPVHEVTLSPFFLARSEMTDAQWWRLMFDDIEGGPTKSARVDKERMPVGLVSWTACDTVLRRHGLLLPTEAQWEYACRSGSAHPWSTGESAETLHGFSNTLGATHATGRNHADGFEWSAPVESFLPNAWGLFDMHGNMGEWTRDCFEPYTNEVRPGDGLRSVLAGTHRIQRGGSYFKDAAAARSATRWADAPTVRAPDVGFRAARMVY